jgi:hypothetical protein
LGRSPDGDQRGVLADPVWTAVACRATDGTWEGLLDELRRDADWAEGAEWTVGVEAGVVRAHQHVAGGRHQLPAEVPAEVVAPVEVDTGGSVESQEISGKAQPGGVGPVPGRVDVQDSPRR